jgi:hydrogenase nickel incorporation protein HypA/HybF
MHEFSLAQSIVDTVINLAVKNGAKQILEVNLLVGEVALVNADQLGWYIDMLIKETLAEGMKLSVTHTPVKIRCLSCGYEGGVTYGEPDSRWHVSVPLFECPECESSQTVIISGKELHIKDMNVRFDEDEGGQEGNKEDA